MQFLSPTKLSIAIGTAILLFVAYKNVHTLRAPIQEIAGQDQGVSFVADFVQTEPNGSRWAGKFYQRADHSLAQHGAYLDPTNGTTTEMISIINTQTQHAYLYREAMGYWVQVPIKASASAVRKYRLKTAEFHGLTLEAEKLQGFTVYRDQQSDGSINLVAPDLAFFALLMQNRGGLRREVSNIQLREPEPSVFVPPAGVKIVNGEPPKKHER